MSVTNDDATVSTGTGAKAKVFISYSRRDLSFADRLDAALRARGFEPLIDRTEIYAFEDWWQRIQALIAQADTIIFVLSPDAAQSDVCAKEVAFAATLNKRLAPLVYRRVNADAVPESLRRFNFIFADDENRFDASMDQLAEALLTDIGWIRKHTEFAEAARRWSAAGRPGPRGLLLRSPLLEEAERWIASRPSGAPPPTEGTQALIAESRKAATQRRNMITGALATALLIALALVGLAYWQRGIAVEQRGIAERNETQAKEERDRALLTQSRFLADLGNQRISRGDPGTGMLLALAALPDEKNGVDRPYAPEAEGALFRGRQGLREHTILKWHQGPVFSASFSPDGLRVVTASSDKTARIWDTRTGQLLAVLKGHEAVINNAVFSPDGSRVLTASRDKTARVWDAVNGGLIAVLRGNEREVWNATFSPDGSRVVTASGIISLTFEDALAALDQTSQNTARIYDAANGNEIAVLRGHERVVMGAAFSPDGTRVVTASGDGARIWDANSGNVIVILDSSAAPVSSAAFSPDGSRVVTATGKFSALEGRKGHIWDAATGKTIAVLEGHQSPLLSAAFSPDGARIVTASFDGTARIWEASSGKEIAVLKGHDRPVNLAAFSPDGSRVVTASQDQTARIYDAENGAEKAVLRGHEDVVNSAAFSPDGAHVVTASSDGTARIWDTDYVGEFILLKEQKERMNYYGANFSWDSTRVATAESNAVNIWDVSNGNQSVALRGHEREVWSVRFSPDNSRVVTASLDQTARIWDARTGQVIAVLRGHEGELRGAEFSFDGLRIVTASDDKTARIWDAQNGQPIATLIGHEAELKEAKFSRDGSRVVTASADKTARIWDAQTGQVIAVLAGHEGGINTAEFSRDGSRVVTASEDKTVRVWNAVSGQPIVVLRREREEGMFGARFAPDGERVLTFSMGRWIGLAPGGGSAVIWDSSSGRVVTSIEAGESPLWSAEFNSEGSRIVTGFADGSARVWDASTGKVVAETPAPFGDLTHALFSPDGTKVLMLPSFKPAGIWRVFPTTRTLIDDAETVVSRCLSTELREQAFLDRAPPSWCIEREKWPYHTPAWKDWLIFSRANLNPPLPTAPEWDDAAYNAAIQLFPKDAQAFSSRGDRYLEKDDFDRAIAYFNQALRIGSDNVSVITRKAEALYRRGNGNVAIENYDNAIADYGEAIGINAGDGRLYLSRGNAYRAKQDYDRAIGDYREAIRLNPAYLDAILALGDALRQLKQYTACVDAHSGAIALIANPSHWDWKTFYFRGICYERAKDWAHAEADLKRALELYPDEPHVLNYLGYSWIDLGVNFDQGLSMIKRAAEQRPDDGYIVDSLGWAFYRIGNYEEAVKQLERAATLTPNDATINTHLGDAYWKVGRRSDARSRWSRAKDLNPEDAELSTIEERLRTGLPD
jgi:WD40 repeat protein/tetratricopeptide (TPR) repeat protein